MVLPVRASSSSWRRPGREAARVLGVTGEAVKQWLYHRRLKEADGALNTPREGMPDFSAGRARK
jgi:hypothetical protein